MYRMLFYRESFLQKAKKPRCFGAFPPKAPDQMRYIEATSEKIRLQICIDEQEKIIVDAKFQAYGNPFCLGFLQLLTEELLRKNLMQARRLQENLFFSKIYSKKNTQPTDQEKSTMKKAFAVLQMCLEQTQDLVSDLQYVTPFSLQDVTKEEEISWETLSHKEKLGWIHTILEKDIRPYLALDEGNVLIKALENDQLHIQYEGSCTTCYAATGSTLQAIEGILRKKLSMTICVIPDL